MRKGIIIYNGTLLTINSGFDIIENGMVEIADGKIAGIKKTSYPLPPAERYIDAKGGIIMPGLVNAHTHLPMSVFRGLADDLPLGKWLADHIFPAEKAHVTEKAVSCGTRLSLAEMLLSGTTTCCDGYFMEEVVVKELARSGIRAVAGCGVIDFPAPGVNDPAENIKAAERFLKECKDVSPRISVSVFCHSPYTCSEKTLVMAKEAAERESALFQIHFAETAGESNEIRRKHEKGPAAFLYGLGLLNRRSLLVHSVWIDEEDLLIMAQSGAAAVYCPESNMKLASGVSPVAEMLKQKIRVGIGTDGPASNNDLDMFLEMDRGAKLQKVSCMNPEVLDAETTLALATRIGADAIGLGDITGSIEEGKAADILVMDTDAPHMTPVYNPVSAVVYNAKRSDVRHVLVDGNILVENRNLLSIDLEKTTSEARMLGRKISGLARKRGWK